MATQTSTKEKQDQREAIAQHIEEYLAKGGKIKVEEDARDIAHNRAQANAPLI